MKKIIHKGKHQFRFKDNPEEKRFAKYWKRLCADGHLEMQMGDGLHPADITQRDAEVAATVIQWLGSPVGQHFLKELGYEK